jgi:chaperonin cofactor prefoldin
MAPTTTKERNLMNKKERALRETIDRLNAQLEAAAGQQVAGTDRATAKWVEHITARIELIERAHRRTAARLDALIDAVESANDPARASQIAAERLREDPMGGDSPESAERNTEAETDG